jgi:hypothetical protein
MYTIFKATTGKDSPVTELIEPVAFDIPTHAQAQRIAFEKTVEMGDSPIFFTARITKKSGPVRGYFHMPTGDVIPDFS